MNRTPREDLIDRLKDPEYAKLYGAENAKVDFAITLAKARKGANLTQKGLSEKLGISQPYVAKLEGGEANPTLGTIGSLLATLGYRLVTQTAPLSPEPMPPAIKFMEAKDVCAYVLYKAAEIPYREEQYPYIPLTAVESMNDLVPGRKADYPRKAAVAGGTV